MRKAEGGTLFGVRLAASLAMLCCAACDEGKQELSPIAKARAVEQAQKAIAQAERPVEPKPVAAPSLKVAGAERPDSRAMLASLKEYGLWQSMVLDFGHDSVFPDVLNVVMVDSFRDESKAERRKAGKALWVLWSKVHADQQPEPTKSRVRLMDRSGASLAKSSMSDGSFIELEDD